MNDLTITGTTLTMSSREIAELVESRHDKVKQSIERLANRGVIRLPPLGEIEEINNLGLARKVKEYRLGKRDSYVVVAQLSPEFTARLVDRWQELEAKAAKPVDPMQVLNDPAAMRGLLLTYTEKVLALQAENDQMKPKAEFYDQFANAAGLYNLQNAGRALKQAPNKFIGWLKRTFLFYQGRALVPYRRYIEMGLFEVISEVKGDRTQIQTFITPKGLQYLAGKLDDPGPRPRTPNQAELRV